MTISIKDDDEKAAIRAAAEKILNSRKYRACGIPLQTVIALFEQERPRWKTFKQTEQAAREKMHQIVAPYLGDPDYAAAALSLQSAAGDETAMRRWAREMLSSHSSAKERLPNLEAFYAAIWARIGMPRTILDLACAMNPFALPWMGLPKTIRYRAFDIHRPRIDLINAFFSVSGIEPLAETRDILLNPPVEPADAAFFFKEAHRFEERSHGCNREFWRKLPARWIVVTLPAVNLTGQHQMRDRQRRLVESNIAGLGWGCEECEVGGEMIFFIDKGNLP